MKKVNAFSLPAKSPAIARLAALAASLPLLVAVTLTAGCGSSPEPDKKLSSDFFKSEKGEAAASARYGSAPGKVGQVAPTK